MVATVAEVPSMLGVIYIAKEFTRSQMDFVSIALIAVGLIAAFSGKSYTVELFSRFKLDWAGKYSLSLYLTHVVWVRTLSAWKLPIPYRVQVVILVVLSLVTALVCMFTVDMVQGLWQCRKGKAKIMTA